MQSGDESQQARAGALVAALSGSGTQKGINGHLHSGRIHRFLELSPAPRARQLASKFDPAAESARLLAMRDCAQHFPRAWCDAFSDPGRFLSMTTGKIPARRWLPGLKVGEGFTRHPFDEEFGVRTSGLIAGRHLQSGHRHDRHATAYYGVAPSVFQALVRRWRKSRPGGAIEEVTFLDVGAGMGRAVLLGAQFPFRQVVGVELNPALARMARKNMSVWRKAGQARAPMKIVCRDAVEFPLPAGPCLALLFNPFGAPVMRRLLAAWSKSLSKTFPEASGGRACQLDLLYVNNEQEHVLERRPGFKRLFLGQVRRSKADALADHRILANQPEGEYASSKLGGLLDVALGGIKPSAFDWTGKLRGAFQAVCSDLGRQPLGVCARNLIRWWFRRG
jgi:SAM-dependent methyltransferase